MDDGRHGALVIISAVSVVAYPLSHQVTIHIDTGGHDIGQMILHDGGPEVVETGQRRCEDPCVRVIGVPDVGDGVVQDQSAVR